MITSVRYSSPKSLEIFKTYPTQAQITKVFDTHVIGRSEFITCLKSEKVQLHIVPIHVPVDILYR